MSNTLTIQKVNGLIKKSPVTFTSQKLPSSASHTRTTGLYAEKVRFTDRIVIGFETWGYNHAADRMDDQLNKFFEFAIAEGYTITPTGNVYGEFLIERAI